jgi:RNA polymerase sigma factor (sigma-70 family)
LTSNAVRGFENGNASTIEKRSDFLHWMGLLEPVERQVMMLRYSEELGYQEIATALGIPLGTVKWKIFIAKERLSAELGAGKRPEL